MSKRGRNIIGIAVVGDALLLAEVRLAGGQMQVLRQSRLPVEADALDADPQAVGNALAAHLRQHHYTSKDAVVGLPAQWLLTRTKQMPAVKDDHARQNMVRLAIEREFKARATPWTFDYYMAEPAGDGTQTQTLLVATRTDLLKNVVQLLAAAKLHPVRIMPTALALASSPAADVAGLLHLSPTGCELVHLSSGQVMAITHLPVDASASGASTTASLASAVSRSLATVSIAAAPHAGERSNRLTLIADEAVDAQALADATSALAGQFAVDVQPTMDAAVALASSAAQAGPQGIDFLHHKLLPAKAAGLSKGKRAAILAAAIVLLLVAMMGYRWYSASSTLTQLQTANAAIADDAQRLQTVRDHLAAADPWFDGRPSQLDCLAALTEAIPSEGDIWVTNLTLDEALAGSVKCKADRKDTMLAYLQAMQDSAMLDQIQLRDWNQAQRDSSLVVFEITFAYLGSEGEGG